MVHLTRNTFKISSRLTHFKIDIAVFILEDAFRSVRTDNASA